MANELTLSASLTFSKDPLSISQRVQSLQVDVAGSHYHHTVQDIGASAEQIVVPGEVATLGRSFLRHAGGDGAENIQIGLDSNGDGSGTFMPFAELAAGEPAMLPMVDGVNYFAKSASGTEPLLVLVVEA